MAGDSASLRNSPELLQALVEAIGEASGERPRALHARPVGGGSIHTAAVITDGSQQWFLKTNSRSALANLHAEVCGLRAIAATGAMRVPVVLAVGEAGGAAYLLLEYLDLRGARNDAEWRALGEALARMHGVTRPRFGWEADNFIGATDQPNRWSASWPAFFSEQRLGYQLALARRNGIGRGVIDLGRAVRGRLDDLFAGYSPLPSLIHGDLWAGNAGVLQDGTPVLFDPAVHYADRECDLAMSALFGGFPPAFYAGYDAHWPRDSGCPSRVGLYQLYHVLNHFNLFGGGYGDQAERLMSALLDGLDGRRGNTN